MTIAKRDMHNSQISYSVDNIEQTDGLAQPGLGATRHILGHVAFLSPIATGVTLAHDIYPGTISESIAASAGFLLSSAVVMARHRA